MIFPIFASLPFKTYDMRKILLLMLVVFSLASCVSVQQFTTTTIVDYSEFAKQGIFVTESNSVNFDYKPLGSVVSVTQGALSSFGSQKIDADKAFMEIASKVKGVGGNGLINFRLNVMASGASSVMTVSGMAIRTDEPIITPETAPIVSQPKNDTYIDGIHCFVFKRFQSGFAVMTDEILSVDQVKRAFKEFDMKGKECQLFLPNTKSPYMGITDNGYLVNYSTNEFIQLK